MLAFFQLSPILQSVSAGLISVLWATVSPSLPIIGLLLAPLFLVPLFFTSFHLGLSYGLVSGLISFIGHYFLLGPQSSILFFIAHFLPFLGISYLFLHINSDQKWSYKIGNILSRVTLFLLIVFEICLFILWKQQINWQDLVMNLFTPLITLKPELQSLVNHLINWIPSFLGLSILFSLATNAIIAQWILQKKGRALRVIDSSDWEIPLYWDLVMTFGLMSWCLGKKVGVTEILIVAKTIVSFSCIPLGAIGLRICYLRLSKMPLGYLWFRIICIFSFLLVWPFAFVVLLGFIEPWYGFTRRFIRDGNKEL